LTNGSRSPTRSSTKKTRSDDLITRGEIDLAKSIRAVTEGPCCAWRTAHRLTGEQYLWLAGRWLRLINCVANGRLPAILLRRASRLSMSLRELTGSERMTFLPKCLNRARLSGTWQVAWSMARAKRGSVDPAPWIIGLRKRHPRRDARPLLGAHPNDPARAPSGLLRRVEAF
jgi:hypothetical protein